MNNGTKTDVVAKDLGFIELFNWVIYKVRLARMAWILQ